MGRLVGRWSAGLGIVLLCTQVAWAEHKLRRDLAMQRCYDKWAIAVLASERKAKGFDEVDVAWFMTNFGKPDTLSRVEVYSIVSQVYRSSESGEAIGKALFKPCRKAVEYYFHD